MINASSDLQLDNLVQWFDFGNFQQQWRVVLDFLLVERGPELPAIPKSLNQHANSHNRKSISYSSISARWCDHYGAVFLSVRLEPVGFLHVFNCQRRFVLM